jgi:hypothetical protein
MANKHAIPFLGFLINGDPVDLDVFPELLLQAFEHTANTVYRHAEIIHKDIDQAVLHSLGFFDR